MSDEIETTTMVLIIPDIQSAFKVSGTGMVRMQFDTLNLDEVQQLMRWGNHKIAATFAPIRNEPSKTGLEQGYGEEQHDLESRSERKSEWSTP